MKTKQQIIEDKVRKIVKEELNDDYLLIPKLKALGRQINSIINDIDVRDKIQPFNKRYFIKQVNEIIKLMG